jgi:hypothetical protein
MGCSKAQASSYKKEYATVMVYRMTLLDARSKAVQLSAHRAVLVGAELWWAELGKSQAVLAGEAWLAF